MEVRLWLLLVGFLVLAQTLGIKCCEGEEREALLNIKAYFLDVYDNEPLVKESLSSWVIDPNTDCCTWDRVMCNVSSGRVSELSLQALNFRPSPDDPFSRGHYANAAIDFSMFQNFKELTSLNFTLGQFQSLENTADAFGLSMGNLCMYSSMNEIITPISSAINTVLGNLSNLEVLALKCNYLEGSLPLQEICKLKKIRVLDFSDNGFDGSLHKCLANLTSLQALDLSGNFLSGEIPESAIASLTTLEYFVAMNNYFKGIFPLSSFTNNSRLKVLALQMYNSEFQVNTESEVVPYWVPLFQLEVLNLANCKVNSPSGTFPSFLLYQHDLHYLDLSNNDLVGVFPNWLLLNNTKLRSLILHHNNFIGTFEFPTDIDQPPPPPLINLQLSDNKMKGKLPANIGLMFPDLKFLNVSGNGLNGGIPPSIGNMSKLFALDFSRNKFSGEVPESLWAGCASLGFLILSHNNLQGKLFPSHLNSSSLLWLFLDNNYLRGTLEHEIWQLPRLEALDISNNNFWGMVPTFITNSSSLRVINLSRNNFTGTLPREFCKLDLLHLHLSHNKLSGSIPACYLNMDLLSLQLQGNSLVGSVPPLLRTGSYLVAIDLRDNNLSGVIPDWIVKVESLRALLLGGNQLQGQLPNQLCQIKRMSFLDLSRNNFTGNIPACFSNVSFGVWNKRFTEYDMIIIPSDSHYQYSPLQLQLFFEQNQYFMTAVASGLEVEFMTKYLLQPYKGDILRLMSGIDFSSNQLTGKVPKEIGYMKSLRALNLSHNHLNGSIPESFHNLEVIESLDLSYNNLGGEIPIQLEDLNFLAVFNVSYNNFSGRVPNGGQFSTFDDSSFKGNQYLIRDNSNRGTTVPVPPPPPSPVNNDTKEDESVIDFTSFIWSFSACYIAVLVIMTTILWINPYWRRLWFYYIETCLYRCLYPYLKDAFW